MTVTPPGSDTAPAGPDQQTADGEASKAVAPAATKEEKAGRAGMLERLGESAKKDGGATVAATGVAGAMAGYLATQRLHMDVELFGAVSGESCRVQGALWYKPNCAIRCVSVGLCVCVYLVLLEAVFYSSRTSAHLYLEKRRHCQNQ